MWAVGENCVAAIKFEISGFYSSGGQALLHTFFCSDEARPPSNFFRGGGGLFKPRGGGSLVFRSNFNSKNHHFSDYFWYNHIMLLH